MIIRTAVDYQHQHLAGTDLVAEVPDGVRRSFDRLRTLFVYGVLEYGFFTIAGQTARLVVEEALRERFLRFHDGSIVLVNQRTSQERVVTYRSFNDIHKACDRKWRLRLTKSDEPMPFTGMLSDLWSWARAEGLLPGQRARSLQRAQVALRNFVAHSSGYQLGTPIDAARAIHDLAEIINCLWGHRTPGGRLHPAPISRSVLSIRWDGTGRVEVGDADDLSIEQLDEESTCILVLAARDSIRDLLLMGFDPRFETTGYPTELLWGPGSPQQARAWFDTNQPGADVVDHLDQHFLIRRERDQTDLPRRVGVAAGLADDERVGTWFLVKADDPITAHAHVRYHHDPDSADAAIRPCDRCAAHTLIRGPWSDVIHRASRLGLDIQPVVPPEVRVPSMFP